MISKEYTDGIKVMTRLARGLNIEEENKPDREQKIATLSGWAKNEVANHMADIEFFMEEQAYLGNHVLSYNFPTTRRSRDRYSSEELTALIKESHSLFEDKNLVTKENDHIIISW